MSLTALELTGRERAFLRAIAAGRGELVCGCEPDLAIDGCWCGDQVAAHHLAAAGLVAPARPAAAGIRVPAVLTDAGRAQLEVG